MISLEKLTLRAEGFPRQCFLRDLSSARVRSNVLAATAELLRFFGSLRAFRVSVNAHLLPHLKFPI